MMVMGLVMLGAIETNQAPLDVCDTTPIAALTSEPEAIVVQADSHVRDLKDLVDRDARPTPAVGRRSRAARPAARTRSCSALLAKAGGIDPSETKYIAYSGGGEANQAILSGSVQARHLRCVGVRGPGRASGKMRCLAVSTASRSRSAASRSRPSATAGFDVVIENWRGVVAPPEILPAERTAMVAALERLHARRSGSRARAQRLDGLLQARRRVHDASSQPRTARVDKRHLRARSRASERATAQATTVGVGPRDLAGAL